MEDHALHSSAASPTYTVTFKENGLPTGTVWGVTFANSTVDSYTRTISFLESNGTYTFVVIPVLGFFDTPSFGTLHVAGSGLNKSVTFVVAPPIKTYAVTFVESGLSAGTVWSVTLNGSTQFSSSNEIQFFEQNGSYPFGIGPVVSFSPSPAIGVIAVIGANLSEAVKFSPPSSVLGLPPAEGYAVVAGFLLAAAIILVLLFILIRQRGPKSGATPKNTPSPPPPPAP